MRRKNIYCENEKKNNFYITEHNFIILFSFNSRERKTCAFECEWVMYIKEQNLFHLDLKIYYL